MQTFLQLAQVLSYTFFAAMLSPIFWVVIVLIFLQYRRAAGIEQRFFGRPINNVGRQVFTSLALGVVGGFMASAVLVLLGLSLEQIGLMFIWPVALLLLLIHPRFLCFAYAGGIVGMAVFLFRAGVVFFPALKEVVLVDALLKIHLPALLVLIALLHLVEAFLIFVGGHKGCSPLYIKEPGGKVVGGFSLQRFWPLPLVALMVTIIPQAESVGVSMPDWWPLIKSITQPGVGQTLQYMAVPVAAGLGYADIALTSTPKEKSSHSARYLALYSIALLAVALAAEFFPFLIPLGVVIAPFGHEMVVLFGNKREFSGRYIYLPEQEGVKVMMVLPDTPAQKADLRADDIILKVNGAPVNNHAELLARIEESYFLVLVEGKRNEEVLSVVLKKNKSQPDQETREGDPLSGGKKVYAPPAYAALHRGAELGLILVPSPDSKAYVEPRKPVPLGFIRKLFKRKIS